MSTYQPGPEVDEIGGISFNGIDTVKQKTAYAINSGAAGVMIWELSHDTQDSTSLLKAIDQEIDDVIQASLNKVLIQPSQLSATASSGQTSYPDPQVVVDGTGMVSETEHSSSWGSWFTDGFELDRWIVVDLGDTYTLKEVHIWNANEAWSWKIYDFKETQVYVTTAVDPGNPVDNPDNWTLVDTVTLTQARGELGVPSPATDILDLTGHVATHVALRALSTYKGSWGTESAGLSELQFYSVGLRADLDDDNDVDLFDLRIFADNWLATGENIDGDVDADGKVNIVDLSVLAAEWLLGID